MPPASHWLPGKCGCWAWCASAMRWMPPCPSSRHAHLALAPPFPKYSANHARSLLLVPAPPVVCSIRDEKILTSVCVTSCKHMSRSMQEHMNRIGVSELNVSIEMPVLVKYRCVDAGTSSRCEGVNSQGSKNRCGGAGPRLDSALWHFDIAPTANRHRPRGGTLPRAAPRRRAPSAPSSQGQPGGQVRGSQRVRRPERLRHRPALDGTYRRPLQRCPQQRQQRALPLG